MALQAGEDISRGRAIAGHSRGEIIKKTIRTNSHTTFKTIEVTKAKSALKGQFIQIFLKALSGSIISIDVS